MCLYTSQPRGEGGVKDPKMTSRSRNAAGIKIKGIALKFLFIPAMFKWDEALVKIKI